MSSESNQKKQKGIFFFFILERKFYVQSYQPARGCKCSFIPQIPVIQIKDRAPTSKLNPNSLLRKTALACLLSPPGSESLFILCQDSFFFFSPAVVHSLMDEMKYPALCGRIPAQAKLTLTGSNAPVTELNEVLGEIERLFHGLCPLFDDFSVCLMQGIHSFHII